MAKISDAEEERGCDMTKKTTSQVNREFREGVNRLAAELAYERAHGGIHAWTLEEFVWLVSELRDAQVTFVRAHSRQAYHEAKDLAREVDRACQEIMARKNGGAT